MPHHATTHTVWLMLTCVRLTVGCLWVESCSVVAENRIGSSRGDWSSSSVSAPQNNAACSCRLPCFCCKSNRAWLFALDVLLVMRAAGYDVLRRQAAAATAVGLHCRSVLRPLASMLGVQAPSSWNWPLQIGLSCVLLHVLP